ncbi:hypothetical protein FS837_011497 [Tulasnella sp. UAMH 9824]|nr:hypothetical protein FS837_011497 [Tulasnella sp. UAMH 9824]
MASQQFDPAAHPTSASSGGAGSSGEPLQWGKWQQTNGNIRHYSLEVVQHPIRARMCGFGDKDRRPLAPAAIAKMITRDEQGQVLDPDDIEIDFFLVTCDLWSADGRVEVNLVRNPASAAASRRRKDHASVGGNSDDAEFGAAGSSRSSEPYQPKPPMTPEAMTPNWNQQGYPGAPPQQQQQQGWMTPGGQQYPSYPDSSYSGQPAWNQEQPIGGVQTMQGYDPRGSYPIPSQPAATPQVMQVPSSGARPKEDKSDYTRTLVGPLTANAARLLDDKKQAGIFFTFQDLSVRTEGTFRLRLRLMNVGAPPAPNRGAPRVTEDVSPVLAQTFTEPFTVYSAKKFPGVPPMTALSLEFGKQGQKLPLRNRPGSAGKGRRGSDEEESGADSDGDGA